MYVACDGVNYSYCMWSKCVLLNVENMYLEIPKSCLKGLSHELDLAFDDMYG
jgi:hypothetical protein